MEQNQELLGVRILARTYAATILKWEGVLDISEIVAAGVVMILMICTYPL